jgi:hypothetical protein
MELKDQISKAIAQHGLWKSRLLKSIETKNNEFDINIVKTDNNCEFGKWLYNTIPNELRNSTSYSNTVKYHAEFHKKTAEVLQLIANGQMEEAKMAINIESDFAVISSNLTLELMAWKRNFS